MSDSEPPRATTILLVENVSPHPVWRFSLLADRLFGAPPAGDPIEIPKGECPWRVDIYAPPIFPALLTIQLDTKRTFRLPAAEQAIIQAWLGAPTLAELVVHLRRNVRSFALPIGVLLTTLAALTPNIGDPVLDTAEGVGLVAVGIGAYLRPHRAWFLIVAGYFAVVAAGHVWALAHGGGGMTLPLLALAVFIVVSDMKLFRRFAHVDMSIGPHDEPRTGHSWAGVASFALAVLAAGAFFEGFGLVVGTALVGGAVSEHVTRLMALTIVGASLLGLVLGIFGVTQDSRKRLFALLALPFHLALTVILIRMGR